MMNRTKLLLALMLFTTPAWAQHTYYIAANGSDSNTATQAQSKSTPWLHAPGMPKCSSNCASYSPVAGDKFIFRGGDTWHTANSSKSPYTGGQWSWTWSGSASSCNWPTSTSSCIYIGVDKTWFAGTSWVRPAFNYDNPISSSLVGSCAFDQSSNFDGPSFPASYVILDNFEFYGHCHSQPNPSAAYIDRSGTYIAIINSYFHGLTETNNPQGNGATPMDQAPILGGGYSSGNSVTHNVIAFNVFDGSDDYCTGVGSCMGGPVVLTDAYDFHGNVCRYLANCLNNPYNTFTVHDNLFENLYESFEPADHGAVSATYGTDLPNGTPIYFYNNVVRNTNIGVTIQRATTSGGALYIFNNVFFNIGNAGNCVQLGNNNQGVTSNFYIKQNTIDGSCTIRFTGGNPSPANGTVFFQNDHFINIGQASPPVGIDGGSTVNVVDSGNEVYQTEAQANAQGYVPANSYAPTSSSSATVSAGSNMSGSCPAFSPDSALCNGTSDGSANGNHVASYPAIAIVPRPSSNAWDVGAYSYGSAGAGRPNPPIGLTATVQ